MNKACELDTRSLPPEEAEQLEHLIEQSGVLGLKSERAEQARDATCYETVLETEDGVHQVVFDDLTLPEQLMPLLKFLRKRSKPRPPETTPQR